MALEIWHNPRCSKSRAALAMVQQSGAEFRVRLYLEDPPSVSEIESALRLLGMAPVEITRCNEAMAAALGLTPGGLDREARVAALAANPSLIERPIVLSDDGRAVLARPPEKLEVLL